VRLLGRFMELSDDDQARFRRFAPDRDDLDAVEAALDKVDPFAQRQAVPQIAAVAPSAAAPPTLPTPADEGGPVDDDAFDELASRFDELGPAEQMWVQAVIAEASQAGVPFTANRSIGRRTVRRFELYRGLLTLAGAGLAGGDDDLVRGLVATVLDSDAPYMPVFTVGHAVGSLDDTRAQHFAGMCDIAANRPTELDLRSRPVAL
jgi:hypothetical protein